MNSYLNSEEIRAALYDSASSSELSIFRDLSDSDDPSVHLSDLDCESDSDVISDGESPLLTDEVSIANEKGTTRPPSDDDQAAENVGSHGNYVAWANVKGNLNKFDFTPAQQPGIKNSITNKLQGSSVFDYYSIFVDEEVLNLLVLETNRFATQCIVKEIISEANLPHSRLSKWVDTTRNELLMFLGLVMWMGLDSKPKLRDYWSKSPLYMSTVSKVMPRNRFEALISLIHTADNENASAHRLYKINPLIELLNTKFQNAFNPDEDVCIDESMIPFRGRLLFRQYIPGKRHKYGLKLYKLCLKGGYTWSVKLYSGKENNVREISVSSKVVMDLMQPLLGEGRTLYTDNYYTSVSLAHDLNNNKTHLVGTLRKRRKHNPDRVVKRKLQRGEMVTKESNTKVVVGKWKDKRDVLFLTTKSVPEMVEVQTKRGPVKKPSTIVQYNSAKSFIDVSDQMASYASPIRRGIKWYRKVMFELLTNTAVVNAHALHKLASAHPMDIIKFREQLTLQLLFQQTQTEEDAAAVVRHHLIELPKRGRCTSCYIQLSEEFGRAHATRKTPQVRMRCPGCVEVKFMCMNCFFTTHNVTTKNK